MDKLLRDGINAARRGDRVTGRRLLQEVIDQDAQNEKAWLWLASCMTATDDRRRCLERVLEINPNNERARQALEALGGSAPPRLSVDATNRLRELSDAPAPSRRASPPAPAPSTADGGDGLRWLIVGVLVLIIVVGVGFLAVQLPSLIGGDDEPTAVAVVATNTPAPPPTFTLPPLPTATIPPFDGTSLAPTLRPTFTPTAEPTDTPAPAPTATPIPQDEFLLLFTALEDGADAPALFTMRGDGSELAQLAADIRDVAFDPSGQQIAFVRDVPFVIGEAVEDETANVQGVFPQIFVAPYDDIDAAQQVTNLPTTINAQPNWSPEARELVFVSDFNGVEDIWTVRIDDGSPPRNLTNGEFPSRNPAWRPIIGSREVVYTSEATVGFEVFKLEVRAEDQEIPITRLTNAPNSYAPSWNANGTRITFLSDRQGFDADVYTMDANGSDQRLVTRDDGGAEDRSPHFSPDGQFIAFVSNRLDERFSIYLITPDGNVLTRLTEGNFDVLQLVYRPELIFRLAD